MPDPNSPFPVPRRMRVIGTTITGELSRYPAFGDKYRLTYYVAQRGGVMDHKSGLYRLSELEEIPNHLRQQAAAPTQRGDVEFIQFPRGE